MGGECWEETQPQAFNYRAWWVGGCEAETIMGREASVVKQHTQHTHGTYAYGVDKYVVWCWLVGLAVCGVGG